LSVLVFGSSLTLLNNAFAVDMLGGDAPATQDTITDGPIQNNGGNDNGNDEGEDNDDSDDLPNPQDAPATSETITIERPNNDGGSSTNNNDGQTGDIGKDPKVSNSKPNCPPGQERPLFGIACNPIHATSQANNCGNNELPLNIGCQAENIGSQTQGDENAVAIGPQTQGDENAVAIGPQTQGDEAQ
jgi:hypothetical protein